MPEVVGLYRYALTGARAANYDSVALNAAGIVDDRAFVLYDTAIDPQEDFNRVSQKQHPELARVSATFDDDGALKLNAGISRLTIPINPTEEANVIVNEWGDLTPAVDAGDDAAELFADFLDRPTVRLAPKLNSWRRPAADQAANRINAPLHIVTSASVRELQARTDRPGFGAERFRPSIIIGDTGEPFIERTWVGQIIKIAGVKIMITRETQRCPVPGYDQMTGENKKDVPRLYRGLAKGKDNKPVFGVYGYPLIKASKTMIIYLGDKVSVKPQA